VTEPEQGLHPLLEWPRAVVSVEILGDLISEALELDLIRVRVRVKVRFRVRVRVRVRSHR
jgi:hypothetical protein